MFDIGWSELLIIAVATLIVVGPKDLHIVLRTIGRYVGILKRQAAEFRGHFDEAMRESEFDQLRQDVENIKSDFESSVRDTTESVKSEFSDMQKTMSDVAGEATKTEIAKPLSVGELDELSDNHNSKVTETAQLDSEAKLGAGDNVRPKSAEVESVEVGREVEEKDLADGGDVVAETSTETSKKTAGA
ncbi:MAG: Sec-independent protein translocase protein TatB [Hyphomicrobiaceae bacterium]